MTISYIGEYQIGNLLTNQVPFLYVYVSESEKKTDHPLLSGVQFHAADGLLGFVEKVTEDEKYPIVLVCDDGKVSQEAAGTLAVAGYQNVFVVDGGANGLS